MVFQTTSNRSMNGFQNALQIREHVAIPKSQYVKSQLPKQFVAIRVVRRCSDVLPTIEFYDHAYVETHKVDNEIAKSMLSTKLRA